MNQQQTTTQSLLKLQGVTVEYKTQGGRILKAVDEVCLNIQPREIVGLVGESGSGKTVLCQSILRLIQAPGCISGGQILWQGKNLLRCTTKQMRQVRGKEIAMIFQNPQASLNPVYTIGEQMIPILRLHRKLSPKQAEDEAMRLLRLVNIPDAHKRINDYPHQFSGGMCQRIMIAMALSCQPKLLIADEPTSALDVTIQAQLLDLLLKLREEFDMAILLVSHDLGVIARVCDSVAVMYLGRVVEFASAQSLYQSPLHPYTQALLESVPRPDPTQRGHIAKLLGDIPSPLNIPSGCRFRSRCPKAFAECEVIDPTLQSVDETQHLVSCLLYEK